MRWYPVILALAAMVPACSAAPGTGSSSGLPTGSGGSESGAGGAPNIDVSVGVGAGGDTGISGGAISNDSGGNIILLHGVPKNIQFTATANGMPLKGGTWVGDDTLVGSIGDDGVFHANGFVGGDVTISFHVGGGQIKVPVTFEVEITENTGNLPGADQTALKAGGTADPAFKFLYPYDGTVFARGLSAPVLQFGDGKTMTGNANGTYLKMTTKHFSYEQFGLGGTPVRVVLPEPVWKGATLSARLGDKVTVAVNKRTGATVTGPITESWSVAQANLKGFIYYSTYKSPLLPWNNATGTGGGILRIKPGSTAEVVRKGCIVCHSVSASGGVLAAAIGPDLSNPTASDTVNLSVQSPTPSPRGVGTTGQQYAFAGLTPDGTLALTNGVPALGPPYVPHGLSNDYVSSLVNTQTGAAVASPSLSSLVKHAQAPAFSPDGKRVTFVNGDLYPDRVLSIMDFDGISTFSSMKKLVTETDTTTSWGSPQPKTVAWPSFTPDGNAILYHEGDSFDSSGFTGGTSESKAQYAELRLVELDGTVKKLNSLNGRDASGASNLPYGEAVENNLDYEPNVMPLPVGGYYWVVFTSRRAYGNTVAPGRAATSMDFDDPKMDPWGSNAGPSPRKKLWVAAVDLTHADPTNKDPSHPAFYLNGQELESANMRAFAALAPCAVNGDGCDSGADCCNGFCRQTSTDASGNPVLQCVPPPMGCSNVDELCKTAADCCDGASLCVNGRCALPPPPK